MKIAIPYENGKVNPHFGQSREFVIFEADGKEIKGQKVINGESFSHNHEGLAGILKAEGVDVVIAGGIGYGMITALQEYGLQVVTGASGDARKAAEDYLNGRLVTDGQVCGCGGHEHGHGHGRFHQP